VLVLALLALALLVLVLVLCHPCACGLIALRNLPRV
jgi:hypothetical protein